ncbi:MAG TPA: hypothetical protein RMH85_17845 [Polyangiaceae bacterium LLY-WYZ-15_(1-7)]|nr:hypothetical protein [Sandaracinus sp.]HJL05013.1 hypothetical protein [Polyangiaceae bacterium LLY-WYZ-15_(1-7)]HJL10368.1 hypothetical protein [Polyangiaceae bacterium LLY-WYZ-15_(1-7)]HJL23062.1 hypothetical protein [Polyangiaceae bacterium LLY-WYZ-15_(1-7)]HJL37793.1 hypothetical protein [Polyangiaceae bacterium LLY-WYZ-15_(1-7)]
MIDVPALAAPGGATPAARRKALAALPDEALAERLLPFVEALREGGAARWEPLATLAGLPLGEVVASPFGLRAIALGVRRGATSVQRELRRVLSWPAELGVADPAHGVWDAGKLHVGKYQSFQADAPFATFDPAHVAKWGPHELMHRAAGFFWRPGATRWELYLGARLNELLPVALWYGADQLARLDEDDFDREAAGRAPAARVEDARWLVEDEAALRARLGRTLRHLRAGLAYVEGELAAVDEERRTGRRVVTPRVFGARGRARLDAASDATAYVVGHAARLADPAVSAVLELVGAVDDVDVYRGEIDACHDALLFEPLRFGEAEARRGQARRRLWDGLHRLALAGEDPAPFLADAARDLEAGEVDAEAWAARFAEALEEDVAAAVLADGRFGLDLDQLADGVASVAPETLARLDALDPEWIERFAEAPPARGRLGGRLGAFLESEVEAGRVPAWAGELAALERAIAEAEVDDVVEQLTEPVESLGPLASLEGGVWVRSAAFRVVEAGHDVVALHQGAVEEPEATPGRWLVGAFRGAVSILPLPDEARAGWEALAEAARPLEEVGLPREWAEQALEAGALGWRAAFSAR